MSRAAWSGSGWQSLEGGKQGLAVVQQVGRKSCIRAATDLPEPSPSSTDMRTMPVEVQISTTSTYPVDTSMAWAASGIRAFTPAPAWITMRWGGESGNAATFEKYRVR